MQAQFASQCPECGDAIRIGEEITRPRGQRWKHAACPGQDETPDPDTELLEEVNREDACLAALHRAQRMVQDRESRTRARMVLEMPEQELAQPVQEHVGLPLRSAQELVRDATEEVFGRPGTKSRFRSDR